LTVSRPATPPPTRRERRAQARLDRPGRPSRQGRRPPARRPVWQSPIALATGGAILVGLVLIVLALPRTPAQTTALLPPTTVYPAGMVRGDDVGAADAPVVMELYSDFQCPACKLFVTTQLGRLLTDFVAQGTLRIEGRDIAFLGEGAFDESVELATGARCAAEQDRYWQFHDYVFWNQGRENRGDHSSEFIARVADAAAVDRTVWDACVARGDVRATIRSETSAALGKGINSTPTLVLNGQSMQPGVPSYDDLATLINQLAAAAATQVPAASPS
jgi:protein-disulfide isomerase